MARVVDALDHFGLSVTSGAVGVLEDREYASGDVHHPLESPVVEGSAFAVSGGDAA
jgi:hypothetical protein